MFPVWCICTRPVVYHPPLSISVSLPTPSFALCSCRSVCCLPLWPFPRERISQLSKSHRAVRVVKKPPFFCFRLIFSFFSPTFLLQFSNDLCAASLSFSLIISPPPPWFLLEWHRKGIWGSANCLPFARPCPFPHSLCVQSFLCLICVCNSPLIYSRLEPVKPISTLTFLSLPLNGCSIALHSSQLDISCFMYEMTFLLRSAYWAYIGTQIDTTS